MTNDLHMLPPTCCPPGGGGDLMPLLWVVVVLLAGHIAIQRIPETKRKARNEKPEELAIVVVLLVAVAAVFALKHNQDRPMRNGSAGRRGTRPGHHRSTTVPATTVALPRLVDLGADKCIPCKMMAPILEELKTTYAGQLQVEFIDVWKNPDAGEQYGIRVIPTQIFFDADGKELFRHEGFFAKEDMLAKWKELGVDLSIPAPQAP